MRHAAIMSLVTLCGQVVLAQAVTVHPPVAPLHPPAVADSHGATNGANPWVELRTVQLKLHPLEEKIIQSDPEIKTLLQQRKDAEQVLLQLDKKRRDLIMAKLLADPAAAPLVKRREELLAKAQAGRTPGVAAAVNDLAARTGVPAAPAKAP